MNNLNLKTLTNHVPELKEIRFNNSKDLLEEIPKKNTIFWQVINFLISNHISSYFEKQGNKIDQNESIYKSQYFGLYSTSVEKELSNKLDLTFPNRKMSKSTILILLIIYFFWINLIVVLLFNYPEILLFGSELIFPNTLLLATLPYILLYFINPSWLKEKKFKEITTLEDLTNDMYGLNLWRYRVDNFNRFNKELEEYLESRTLS